MAESENIRSTSGPTRRGVLRGLAGTLGAALAANTLGGQPATSQAARTTSGQPEVSGSGDIAPLTGDLMGRMQAELEQALARPREERRWIMVIDLRKCVGCDACTIACVAENKLPPGVVYRPVLHEEIGTYPNVTRKFTPRPCMQCDNPPCTPVCPVHATWKDEDGIVVVDYDQCIGCRYCITACPYAARTFDLGYTYTADMLGAPSSLVGQEEAIGYERIANAEYGEAWDRHGREESPIGNVRKCHFCAHRVQEGLLPSCVTTCIGRATLFGDANDPDSLVAEMIAKPNVVRLKEEMGTEPRVYYLL